MPKTPTISFSSDQTVLRFFPGTRQCFRDKSKPQLLEGEIILAGFDESYIASYAIMCQKKIFIVTEGNILQANRQAANGVYAVA